MSGMSGDEKKAAAATADQDLDTRVANWVGSQEGTAKLVATREAAKAAADRVRTVAKIEPDKLRKPVTV